MKTVAVTGTVTHCRVGWGELNMKKSDHEGKGREMEEREYSQS